MTNLGLCMGVVLRSPGEFVFRFPETWPGIGGFGLRWYGVCMTLAVMLAFFLSQYLAERQRVEAKPGLAAAHVESLALGLIVGGFAGARAYYVLTHWSEYEANPWSSFAIWQGGIIIHGGILAGALFLFLYARRTGIDAWRYADILTPGLILGQAIGRLGNFFNAEAYGAPIAADSAWPIKEFIPSAMRVYDAAKGIDYRSLEYYHPIFLYEIVLNLLLFALLMVMFAKFPKLKVGTWVWTYVIGYSLIRIPYEVLRVSAVAYLGSTGIKVAYVASAIGIILGIAALVYMYGWRFDPDFEAVTAALITQTQVAPEVAQSIVSRAWIIHQRHRQMPIGEKVTLAMPNFPLDVAQAFTVKEREQMLTEVFQAFTPPPKTATPAPSV